MFQPSKLDEIFFKVGTPTIQTDIDSCGLVVAIKYKKDEQASSAARMNYFFFLFLAVSFKFETLFKYFKVILL